MRDIFYFIYISILNQLSTFKRSHRKSYDLVIVKTDLIGDLILFLPFLEYTKNQFENKKTLIICSLQTKRLLQKMYPMFDVHAIDTKVMHTKKRIHELRPINNTEASCVIYPVYSREFFSGDSIVNYIKAKKKIGFLGEFSNISKLMVKISNFYYSCINNLDPEPRTEIERNLEILNKAYETNQNFKFPEIHLDTKTRENIALIAVGGSWSGKKWPLERFIEIAKYIKENLELEPIFCGTMSDVTESQYNELEKTGYHNLIGKTNLIELMEKINCSRLVVCNDSSSLHFASALKVPVISFVGGGHFGRFAPWKNGSEINQIILNVPMDCYNCQWSCPYVKSKEELLPCIDKISVEMAKEALTSLQKKGAFIG